jgi:kynureninase
MAWSTASKETFTQHASLPIGKGIWQGRRVIDSSRAAAAHRDADLDPPIARDHFHLMPNPIPGDDHTAYLVGNSLGLMPIGTRDAMNADLDAWETLGVRGHSHGDRSWMSYPQRLVGPSARIVGALPEEVVIMNGLTINLHLLLTSFYRPSDARTKIVIEDYAFSSDSYAVRSHVAAHGLDPDEHVLRLQPRDGEDSLRTEDVIATLREHGDSIATVLLGAVNYLSGEFMDVPAITRTVHDIGAMAGWDLAHAAGNVPLRLHDWNVDFAAWCSYKYLNSGPGSIAGAFIHERHLGRSDIPRLEGWWGNRPETRFRMDRTMDPWTTAEAWSVSCSPVFIMSPALTSLEIFDVMGMDRLRARSLELTDYLLALLDVISADVDITVTTPRQPERHGAQVSIRVPTEPFALIESMYTSYGVLGDARNPDIIRLAPAPLYNTFEDVWRGVDGLSRALGGPGLPGARENAATPL